jgi:DNA replication licensing factor MCM2
MLRMSEAHAKMHLRDFVKSEDVNMAIKMLLESFLQSQKSSIAAELRPKFAKYLTKNEDDYSFLMHELRRIV